MAVDPMRHLLVFSPQSFVNRRIDIIGCGATGSRVAIELARLGIEHIHVWDFDRVESHNLANQCFGSDQVGMSKTEALAAIVARDTGVELYTHDVRVEGGEGFGDVVFLLTDTMTSRREIWEHGLKLKLSTQYMIETRLSADGGRIYAIDPRNPRHIRGWEATLYSDEEAERSACGGTISVGATATMIAGLAVWQFLRWWAVRMGGSDELDQEIIISTRPMHTMSRRFR